MEVDRSLKCAPVLACFKLCMCYATYGQTITSILKFSLDMSKSRITTATNVRIVNYQTFRRVIILQINTYPIMKETSAAKFLFEIVKQLIQFDSL